ncbi:hypothetical protein ACQUY5_31450 [Bacillus cereus]|uniref:hypothetical protein n=1 Tax=Bacillus cereus TaxID=1396 RepID=UPI003D17E1D4
MCKVDHTCKAKGCKKREVRKGFCKIHLIQFLNGEEVETGKAICIIEDCDAEPVISTGYCNRHKNQIFRYGKAYTEQGLKEFKPNLFCKEKDCLNRKSKGGYCKEHSHLQEDLKVKCIKPNCNYKNFKQGLCRQHYMDTLDFSQLKGVTTPFDKLSAGETSRCKIKNCNQDGKYEGYCPTHARLILSGELEEHLTGNGKKLCKIDGCDGIHKAKGYCLRHYQQFKIYGKAFTDEEHKEMSPKYYCIEEGCTDKRIHGAYCEEHAIKHMNDTKAICFTSTCYDSVFRDGKCVTHYYDSINKGE